MSSYYRNLHVKITEEAILLAAAREGGHHVLSFTAKSKTPQYDGDRLSVHDVSTADPPHVIDDSWTQVHGLLGTLVLTQHVYLMLITQCLPVAADDPVASPLDDSAAKGHIYLLQRTCFLPIGSAHRANAILQEAILPQQRKEPLPTMRPPSGGQTAMSSSASSLATSPTVADQDAPRSSIETYDEPLPSHHEDEPILREYMSWFHSGTFYFAYDVDLTSSRQRRLDLATTLFDSRDDRFDWSSNVQTPLRTKRELAPWCLPLIMGYVGQAKHQYRPTTDRDSLCYLTLMSRREKWRPGMRYVTRGADEAGHVANHVETEQVFYFTNVADDVDHVVSFVQVRGSS